MYKFRSAYSDINIFSHVFLILENIRKVVNNILLSPEINITWDHFQRCSSLYIDNYDIDAII